jgi:DNA replication protein DnaC
VDEKGCPGSLEAGAIVDRLLGDASVLNIRGRSYRMRAYQQTDQAAAR